ncbi:MAG TPA: FeoA family protein [Gammaproteobacteria bacterium]|nr:FeoA family protein [Gammaproteobacteria bacterium]
MDLTATPPLPGDAGATAPGRQEGRTSLAQLPRYLAARITAIVAEASAHESGLPPGEVERRLVEMGFVEGATVRIEHVAGLASDPIGVRLDGRRLVALRRREARCILVEPFDGPSR